MIATYAPLILLFAVAALLVTAFFLGAQWLGPRAPNPEKLSPFESGNPSAGARHSRMSVKFYVTAMLFVVFDIESVFLYIWAVHFRSLGTAGFLLMTGFLAVLVLGLIYALRKGALEWHK